MAESDVYRWAFGWITVPPFTDGGVTVDTNLTPETDEDEE